MFEMYLAIFEFWSPSLTFEYVYAGGMTGTRTAFATGQGTTSVNPRTLMETTTTSGRETSSSRFCV